MKAVETELKDCFIIKPRIIDDGRGYFYESFNQKKFSSLTGFNPIFVQDNQSMSHRGVLRGLHFQKGEFAQAKLVRVIRGKVLDIVVDIRPNSKTFGKSFSVELSEENKLQLFVSRGFAHGFSVLEDNTVFSYKCDNYYNKDSEGGIIYNDEDLKIDWKLKEGEIQLSDKDKSLPKFKTFAKELKSKYQ